MNESTDKIEKKEIIKKTGLFRTSVISTVVIFSMASLLYTSLFLDKHLTSVIKSSFELLYGATVDVERFSLSFRESKVTIKTIRFVDKKNLKKDKVLLSNLELDISIRNLLLKKLIIENIRVGNIEFDTKRAKPGKIFNDPSSQGAGNPYIIKTLRKEEKKFLSFAKNLSPAAKVETIKKRGKLIDSEIDQIKSFDTSSIKQQVKSINDLIKSIKKERNLPKQVKMAKEITKKTKKLKKDIKNKKKEFTKKTKSIKKSISTIKEESTAVISQSKKFIDTKSLKSIVRSFAIKRINEEVAPITSLISEYESYLPKLKSKGKIKEVSQAEKISKEIKRSGATINFQRVDDLPIFLLRKLQASSKYQDKKFNLELNNITNKFNKKIKKSTAVIDFSKKGGEKVKGKISFDPTTIYAELLSSNKTIFNKKMVKTNVFEMFIESGIETWDFKFKKTNLNSEIIFSKNYSSTNISLRSSDSGDTVNEILKNASKKINNFHFNFGYNEKTKNKFLVKSNLINDLPKAIELSGKDYLNSIVEKNQKLIQEQILKEKNRLRAKVKRIEIEVLSKIKTKIPKFDLKKITKKNKSNSIQKIKNKAQDELLKKIKIPKVKLPKF